MFIEFLCVGIENSLARYNLASFKCSILYFKLVKLPNVPLNISSCFLNNFRIHGFSLLLRYFNLFTFFINWVICYWRLRFFNPISCVLNIFAILNCDMNSHFTAYWFHMDIDISTKNYVVIAFFAYYVKRGGNVRT